MKCQKCGALNSETAEFCSLCFVPFKSKAVAKAPTILIPEVLAEFGYWETTGPLLVTRDAMFFFVKTLTDTTDKKDLKRQIHNNLLSKGPLSAALGLAFSSSFEVKRPLKPEEVHVRVVHWDKEPLMNLADHKSSVDSCDEYFMIDKKELKAINMKFMFRFQITTATAELTTNSIEEHALLSGFLRSSGFPFDPKPSNPNS